MEINCSGCRALRNLTSNCKWSMPSRSISLACAASNRDSPMGTCTVLTELSLSSWKVTAILQDHSAQTFCTACSFCAGPYQTHVSADFGAEEEVCWKLWTESIGRRSAAAAAFLTFDARLRPRAALSMERRNFQGKRLVCKLSQRDPRFVSCIAKHAGGLLKKLQSPGIQPVSYRSMHMAQTVRIRSVSDFCS